MRFKKYRHEEGSTRTKRAFLVFPKEINYEVRWLEWAEWTQREYHNVYSGSWFWTDVAWVNK